VIALEVLRQFEPRLYQDLFAARALLTGVPNDAFGPGFSLEKPKAADALIGRANRAEAKDILINVFPPFAWALTSNTLTGSNSGSRPAAYRAEWLKDLRACHPSVFERYFRFSLSENELSESEIARMLQNVRDREALRDQLNDLGHKNLLGSAVSRLAAQTPSVSVESAPKFAAAVFDVERELFVQPLNRGAASVSVEIQAVLVVDSVLRQLDVNSRFKVINDTINATSGVYLPMVLLGSPDEMDPPVDPLVNEVEYRLLKDRCVAKLKSTTSDDLLTHPRLPYLLAYWSSWGGESEPRAWMATILKNPDSTLKALRTFVQGMNKIEGGKVVSTQYRFALQDFAKYADPGEIVEGIRDLARTGGDGQDIYRLFLLAFDRFKASGRYSSPRDFDGFTDLENLADGASKF
jgi:predicted KAP-like P-loop ATPase